MEVVTYDVRKDIEWNGIYYPKSRRTIGRAVQAQAQRSKAEQNQQSGSRKESEMNQKKKAEYAQRMMKSVVEHNVMALVKNEYDFEYIPSMEIKVVRSTRYYPELRPSKKPDFEATWRVWHIKFAGYTEAVEDENGELKFHIVTEEEFEKNFERVLKIVECDEHYYDPDTDFFGVTEGGEE